MNYLISNKNRVGSFAVLWPCGGTGSAHKITTKWNALKMHWALPSIDGLLVSRPSRPRCPPLIAPRLDGLNCSHDGEQATLHDVCPLLVKIERWILCADYV